MTTLTPKKLFTFEKKIIDKSRCNNKFYLVLYENCVSVYSAEIVVDITYIDGKLEGDIPIFLFPMYYWISNFFYNTIFL